MIPQSRTQPQLSESSDTRRVWIIFHYNRQGYVGRTSLERQRKKPLEVILRYETETLVMTYTLRGKIKQRRFRLPISWDGIYLGNPWGLHCHCMEIINENFPIKYMDQEFDMLMVVEERGDVAAR